MTTQITYKVGCDGFFVKSLERPTLDEAKQAIEAYATAKGLAQDFRIVEFVYSEQDDVKITARKEVFSISY